MVESGDRSKFERVRRIRERLPHAWSPFFGRFGRLLPVQMDAIPAILDGRNVVVATPTASGKTEAVVAPLAEQVCTSGLAELAVVYIVPTRALANDLVDRIGGPLSELGIPFAIKHGEAGTMAQMRGKRWIVTTPESLDSMLCRTGDLLDELQAVVVDEVHLTDGTYRGDQLMVLLERLLRRAAPRHLAVHLLSATLPDARAVGQRYVSEFEVIDRGLGRKIEYEIVPTLADAVGVAKRRGDKKNLVFCNSRARVEEVANELAPLWRPYPVVCHHGSLSRPVRKEAEAVMRERAVALAVATSTLEVGIDIGDIDLVILADVPWSVAALVQRVGRGNRRGGRARCLAVAGQDVEAGILEGMFQEAIEGHLEQEDYEADLSVVVQQTFSRLFEARGEMDRGEMADLVAPLCSAEVAARIWEYLDETEWIRLSKGRLLGRTQMMDLGARGEIHSNIPDSGDLRVINVESGQQVGRVSGRVDQVFVLDRRAWQVLSRAGDTLRVRPYRGGAKPPSFDVSADSGAFTWLLPPEMRDGGKLRG